MSNRLRRRGKLRLILAIASFTVAIALFNLLHLPLPTLSPSTEQHPFEIQLAKGDRAMAQRILDRRAIALRVHQQLPDLPLENHYIHEQTGETDSANTLVHRLIRYHYDVKSRPLGSRFDWKLTLADYLGANEVMNAETYPDRRLTANPYAQDVEIIRRLNRQQREALIQAILFTLGVR